MTQYQIIDMDNGNCAYDRLTLTEAIDKLSEGNYALMIMEHENDNYTVRCSFCKRQGFEPDVSEQAMQSKGGKWYAVKNGELKQVGGESEQAA